MAKVNIDLSKYDTEFFDEAMNRVESAARLLRDTARRNLASQVTGLTIISTKKGVKIVPWKEHGPYKGGSEWTARYHNAMVKSIRVRRSYDKTVKNVWVMAGNKNTWWAIQLEYGHGQWHGGAKPFMRRAINETKSNIVAILEGGAAYSGEKEYL